MLQDQDEMSLWARFGNEEDNLCPKGHLLVYVSYKLLVTMFLAMDSQGESRKDTTSGSSKKLQKTDGIFWYTKQTAKI